MNWDDLRILDALARAGSLSAAARALKLSQPQLSRRLRGLEETMGTRLFDRLPHGLVPTETGARLIPLAAEMGQVAEAVDRARSGLGKGLHGNVRISADEVMARFLTDHLASLRTAAPDIVFEIAAGHAFANLSRREADLLIRRCLPTKGSDLIAKRLGTMNFAVYGSKRYLRRNPTAFGEDRYTDCDWIGLAESGLWFEAEKVWLDRRFKRPPCFRTNQMTVARDAALADQGLVLLPCFLGQAETQLLPVTPPLADVTVSLHLLIHRDILREPAMRIAVDAIGTIFHHERRRLLGDSLEAGADAAD